MVLVLLGLSAGALSTVAGMGGGMLLVLSLTLLFDPLVAVALSAPALLSANAHRAWLYRAALDRRVAGAFMAGAVPGALIGSLTAVALPSFVIPWILLCVALVVAARGLGWVRWEPGPRGLVPAGAAMGGLSAVSGAGMVGPVLLAAGLRGDVFIATASASAVAMHLTRALGYGLGGALAGSHWASAALLALGLIAGNLGGRRVRAWLGDAGAERVGYVVMAAIVVLALAGVA